MDTAQELLTVALLPGITPRLVAELRKKLALRDFLSRPGDFATGLPAGAPRELLSGRAFDRAQAQLGKARDHAARVVGLDDPDYPKALRATYDPPPVLFVQGALAEATASVAVVGARGASPAGRAFARSLARDLAAAGALIVSGLARGIDGEAHRGTLEARGRTFAVLGSGLDCLYPKEHADLARAIVAGGGAVLSEFPFGTGPQPHHFPRRNRIIAGLARATLVVEAAEKSGALSTARFALDEGREVLAVPGHPTEPLAAGTNALLRDGATLVRSAADVAEALGLVISVTTPDGVSGDDLLDSLRRDRPVTLEELQVVSGRPVSELLSRLSLLEIESRVRRLPGPAYVRA